MISAKEAKALYDASGKEAEQILLTIEPKIIDASNRGERKVFIHLDASEVGCLVAPTALQTQIIDKLIALGYRVQFASHGESYVPRGLSDDDGNGPRYTNLGFIIQW